MKVRAEATALGRHLQAGGQGRMQKACTPASKQEVQWGGNLVMGLPATVLLR